MSEDRRDTDRLRVLFIHDTSRNGGPGRTILYILKFLDPRRVHRTVVIPREDIVSGRIRQASAAEIIVIQPDLVENLIEPLRRPIERTDFDAPLPLRIVRAVINVMRASRGVLILARRVRGGDYDLVFCNGTTANFVGGALARMSNVPVVWHVLYPSVAPLIRGLHGWLAKSENVRRIICVSSATTEQFADCASKVLPLSTALDIHDFELSPGQACLRRELGLSEEVVILGAHGRILPRKGFVELIHAARCVFDQLSSSEKPLCRFVILGDTPEDIRPDHLAECRDLASSLALEAFVSFIGFRADVRPYLMDFDVAVVPSVYEDPMPRAVMEAMAMSKPIVAFDRGGISEMIDDGVEGRLVEGRPPDIDGLTEACLSYIRDRDRRLRDGLAARRRIERQFNSQAHAARLQQIFFQIASGPAPR